MILIEKLLREAGVKKFTRRYCEEVSYSTPLADTLWGIKRALDKFGVTSHGVKFPDTETDVPPFPSIIHSDDAFSVATAENWEELKPRWDGIALIPDNASEAVEPDYGKHRLHGMISALLVVLVAVLPFLACIVLLKALQMQVFAYLSRDSLPDLIGLLLTLLLLEKSLSGESALGDKVCALMGKNKTCNNVLQSKGAYILGFSWSELGFSYFYARLLLAFTPIITSPVLSLVSICAMLYAFWSVWYQWKKVESWCMLCLLVQLVLWISGGIAIYNLIRYGYPEIEVSSFFIVAIWVAIIMAVTILVTHMAIGYYSEYWNRCRQQWKMRGLLRRKDIFTLLLEQQPVHDYTEADANESQGNPDCPFEDSVIIYTRPKACVHCRHLLEDEKKFLDEVGERIAIRHINLDLMTDEQRKELSDRIKLSGTPTVLLHHHNLPDSYRLEDLIEIFK